jgi:hypothetical protein
MASKAATDGTTSTARGATGSAWREWRHGWPVVLAGLFGFVLANATTHTMGAFMAPIQEAFGWKATASICCRVSWSRRWSGS